MKVADAMTRDVLWLEVDEPVSQAAWTLAAEFISGAPVRDRNGKLVGVLSNADLAKMTVPQGFAHVRDLMTPSSITISEDASLEDAVALFSERGVHRVLVTNARGDVVGVLSSLDLIRGIHRSSGGGGKE